MRHDHLAYPPAYEHEADFAGPLSCLYREAGLAAVAAELHLQVDTLEPEVAEAVERGAAALFLSGYGPHPKRTRQRAGVAKQSRRRAGAAIVSTLATKH